MQPGSQQRPEAFDGVDLAEAIAVLVPGVFASTMTDGLVAVAETRKPGVDAILVGIDVRAFGFSMSGWRVACWASIRITTWPPRSIMPKIGGFSFSKVPRPRIPFKDSSSNNLNSSGCDKLLAGAQAVVPFTMKLVPLEGQFSKLFVRHLEPRFVGILVQLGPNVEPCFGGRAADQIDHDLAAGQGASAPVVGDVAEHPMFDRVPLAGSGWKVTDLDLNAELIGQLLQLAFPPPIPVGAATIRRNQHAAGRGIAGMTHFF